MNHTKKLTLFMALVMLFVSTLAPFTSSAADARLNNTLVTNENFFITDGVATVAIAYTGYESVTTGADVHVSLQKKTLLWWNEVYYWSIFFNGWHNSTMETLQLEKTGEYRVVIEYTVSGRGSEDDVFTVTLYDEYRK